MSGIGKGIASSSIGRILKSKGFKVTAIKIDPYINVDAGTMNPTEHGEVFVLDDGMECRRDVVCNFGILTYSQVGQQPGSEPGHC